MSNNVCDLCIDADFLSVREIADWLPNQLQALLGTQVTAELAGSIELCIHELAINIVEHAYGAAGGRIEFRVSLDLQHDASRVRFDVTDSGSGFEFDGGNETAPEVPSIRGYGLLIVKQLSSDIQYRRSGDSNHWTIHFDVPSSSPHHFQHSKASS
jgi:anti-sigma regulatory factor (Ser/Thr protein kinase)